MFTEFSYQIENYMLYCDAKSLSTKTKASYEQTLGLFRAYLQNHHKITDARDVKAVHIRAYIKHLKERGKYTVVNDEASRATNDPSNRKDLNKPISITTVANYLRNIKVFFNFLVAEREIKVSPAENIPHIKPERKKKSLLSESQLRQIMHSFDTTTFHGFRNWCMTRLILDTGARIGECVNLKPQDVDFKTRTILITNPKNRKQRYVFISLKFAKELRRWMLYRDRYSDSEYLFPTNRGNKQDTSLYAVALKKAGKEIGVDVSPHLLRNNFAKYYLLNGGDFATLSRILGHTSVDVTMRAYLDFSEDEIGRKYQKHSPLNNMRL